MSTLKNIFIAIVFSVCILTPSFAQAKPQIGLGFETNAFYPYFLPQIGLELEHHTTQKAFINVGYLNMENLPGELSAVALYLDIITFGMFDIEKAVSHRVDVRTFKVEVGNSHVIYEVDNDRRYNTRYTSEGQKLYFTYALAYLETTRKDSLFNSESNTTTNVSFIRPSLGVVWSLNRHWRAGFSGAYYFGELEEIEINDFGFLFSLSYFF